MRIRTIWADLFRIYLFHIKLGFRRFFGNIGYNRFWEYSLVYHGANLDKDKTHLDIGSGIYGEFPLFLKYKSNAVIYSSDILDYFNSQIKYVKKLGFFDSLNKDYFIKQVDSRKLKFAKETFDSVSFISTIEHIPDDGDSITVKEVSKVLKKGGKLLITVPFSPKEFKIQYKKDEVYERKDIGKMLFFQRIYDKDSIYKRLVEPSGLRLDEIYFFGEKGLSFYKFWHKTPLFLNLPFRILMPIFSMLFIKRIKEDEFNKLNDKNWYFAYISLKKE